MMELQLNDEERWMRQALKEAERAYTEDEVPIGAVVVHEGRIIGRGRNQTERLQDPTAHAEMLAISAAANALHSWRLETCSLYVTLEPCSMCAGAVVLARIESLYFGAFDPKAGACGSLRNIVQDDRLNHRVTLRSGILEAESSRLLTSFFRQLRAEK